MPVTTLRRVLPAVAAVGLSATLGACGSDSHKADAPSLAASASSSTNTGKPGATPALRSACISTNQSVVDANDTWNKAVDSHKSDDMSKATKSMTTLATDLRAKAKSSGNATFKTKAEKVATQVDTLKNAEKPSKTVDTSTYNNAVNDLTSYCTQMFPGASSGITTG